MSPRDRSTNSSAGSTFHVESWGGSLFQIGPRGTMLATPTPRASIDLHEVTVDLRKRGIQTPLLIRLPDILKHKLEELRDAFTTSIESNGYQGGYTCVYPIKVNQNRAVCEQIRDIATPLGFGLEVGSKPELLATLGITTQHLQMPIICNGFKDDRFLETALLATKLGHNITPVVERLSELKVLIRLIQQYKTPAKIGLRYKLSAAGGGRWKSSAGPRSKFGLDATDLLKAVDLLQDAGVIDQVSLLHFHLGSQVCDIRRIKDAISELAHLYTALRSKGAPIETIDVGGGLGIDYDGSASNAESSMNYSLSEYAEDIVYRIMSVCDANGHPHPGIISESGRAIVAESSVLVFNILGQARYEADVDPVAIRANLPEETPQPISDLIDTYERLAHTPPTESFHDAQQAREQAVSLFGLGMLSLEQRSLADQLFWACTRGALDAVPRGEHPQELAHAPELLSDIYYGNFSVFQSLPDSWAIGQLFPVCPIHRLHEPTDRTAIIADITCDSDGQITRFPTPLATTADNTLKLHSLREGEPYYLGVFLVGAYQQVLGDLHNLFGETNVVHVSVDKDGGWRIDEVLQGDTVHDVLGAVHYDTDALKKAMRQSIQAATRSNNLTSPEGEALMNFFEKGLDGSTYLD